jgi:hypothetical protein
MSTLITPHNLNIFKHVKVAFSLKFSRINGQTWMAMLAIFLTPKVQEG